MSLKFGQNPHRSTLDQTGQVIAYGSSIIAGNSASDTTRDMMTRLAAMLGAKEYNYAKGGAQLMWVNDVVNGEYGTLGAILQTWKRANRPAGVLTSNVSAGASTIPVTPNPSTGSTTTPTTPFKVDDIIHIGTGAAGATGGEVCRVNAVTATNLDLFGSEVTESYVLQRNHLAGEPVYVVPTHYGAGNTLFMLWASQVAPYGSGVWTNAQRWFQDALRMALSRLRAAEVYEPDHTALTFGGSWAGPILGPSVSGSTVAQGAKNPTLVNASVTFNVPNNFPGGAVSFNVASTQGNTGGGVWTFTVDGVSAGTMTQVATPTSPRIKPAYFCKRFTGLTAGRHQIVATMTTLETNTYFDNFVIEAIDPPIVVLFTPHRFLSYDGMTSIFDHGHIRPTLAAQASAGATSISVNQSPLSTSRQLAAGSVPKAGEFLVIDPQPGDVAPQEVRVVTSVTGTGPFTINFSGGALASTHASGTRCELGGKDYDVRNVEGPWISSVAAEFDTYVVLHDMDPYINKSAAYFNRDFVQWQLLERPPGHELGRVTTCLLVFVLLKVLERQNEERRSASLTPDRDRPTGKRPARADRATDRRPPQGGCQPLPAHPSPAGCGRPAHPERPPPDPPQVDLDDDATLREIRKREGDLNLSAQELQNRAEELAAEV
jgi:hypothetical protein